MSNPYAIGRGTVCLFTVGGRLSSLTGEIFSYPRPAMKKSQRAWTASAASLKLPFISFKKIEGYPNKIQTVFVPVIGICPVLGDN